MLHSIIILSIYETYPNALFALSTNAKAKKMLQIDIVIVKVVSVLTSEQSRINWCRSPSCVAVYFSVRAPAPASSVSRSARSRWMSGQFQKDSFSQDKTQKPPAAHSLGSLPIKSFTRNKMLHACACTEAFMLYRFNQFYLFI